ncbi:GNAT family protein [Oscillospiraceae bacterium MB08-C2-2]|nr:GNAT family protein [Oscillospiraceae bacterium MB08-C2-2]
MMTPRLLLREYKPEDFPFFRDVYMDEEVMRYAYMDAYKTEQEAREGFEKLLPGAAGEKSFYEWTIVEQATGLYVGSAMMEVQMKNQYGGFGELGYFLLKEFWGKGYATETARALIALGFDQLGFHRVCASCNAANNDSAHVLEKAGMRHEGVLRAVRCKNGLWQDEIRYSILAEEWEKA